MTNHLSDPLAASLHAFRAVAFALPRRDWATLPAHTRHQWRQIADRLAPRLPHVTGRACFEAWAGEHLNTTWEAQPLRYRERWIHLALLVRTAAERDRIAA